MKDYAICGLPPWMSCEVGFHKCLILMGLLIKYWAKMDNEWRTINNEGLLNWISIRCCVIVFYIDITLTKISHFCVPTLLLLRGVRSHFGQRSCELPSMTFFKDWLNQAFLVFQPDPPYCPVFSSFCVLFWCADFYMMDIYTKFEFDQKLLWILIGYIVVNAILEALVGSINVAFITRAIIEFLSFIKFITNMCFIFLPVITKSVHMCFIFLLMSRNGNGY